MNEEKINAIKEAVISLKDYIKDKNLDNEQKLKLAKVLEYAANRIVELRSEEQQPFQSQVETELPPKAIGAAPSSTAQLLWILAGQQEDVFINYLSQFPSIETQQLLSNPAELERTLQFLHQMMPMGQQPIIDEIQHSHLNSSNVFGSKYDANKRKLTVRFQNGSEYVYDGVPANIYRAFAEGAASARTNGKNNFGAWWKGKNPSLGASLNEYIKEGGYPYQKVR